MAGDNHDVGVAGESIHEGCEMPILHFHRIELTRGLAAAELELLDNVTDLLVAVDIGVFPAAGMTDHEKGRPLEEHHLIRLTHSAESRQLMLQLLDVRDEAVYDRRPGFVQGLIPDTRPEDREYEALGESLERSTLVLIDPLPFLRGRDQIHFVDQTEDSSVRAQFLDRRETAGEIGLVLRVWTDTGDRRSAG